MRTRTNAKSNSRQGILALRTICPSAARLPLHVRHASILCEVYTSTPREAWQKRLDMALNYKLGLERGEWGEG